MNTGGRGKPKIRPPRRGIVNVNNDIDFEETWNVVSASLYEMHTKNASKLSFEAIYRHAYKIVLKKKGEVFYDRLQKFEHDWLSQEVRKGLQKSLSPTLLRANDDGATAAATMKERRDAGERFLRNLKDAWQDHQIVMNMATDVFMYLDRVYCAENRRPSIYSAAMMQFRDCILRTPAEPNAPTVIQILNQIMLEQIAMERDGDMIDKPLIKNCVYMLEGLHETVEEKEQDRLYLTSFESDFLSATQKFYQDEGARLLAEADAATYCRHTIKRIKEEQDRCRSTLSEATTDKLTKVVEQELIKNKMRQIISMESGVKYMVDNDHFQDLELIYDLNSRIDPKKTELTEAIQRRIHELGAVVNSAASTFSHAPLAATTALVDKEKSEPEMKSSSNQQTLAAIQWVNEILQLKDKFDKIWHQSLNVDAIVQPALTKSFTDSINSFPRSSEFISLFIDENMKKGLKDKTESEVDLVLERAIILLRYVQDKDMFERYYKKHLCKRLLMGKSVSIDVEKQMISRMKIELGNSFTSKLEAMFKDMELSEELTAGYRKRVADAADPKRTELSIHVLTSMTWPLETMQNPSADNETKSKCIYPANIERIKKGFESFYGEKHSGRMLTWMGNMGTADIKATFPRISGKEGRLGKDRRHDLNVSTYAMIILMLFNDLPGGESLSFDEIQSKTNIGTSDLIRNLQALAVAPKTRVLVKEPMSKDVKNTDRFSFNEGFQSNFLKIKVGVVAANNKVEGERERRETEQKNNDSRGFAIEAAAVRIMKHRKEFSHQQLVAEILTQLNSQFKPDVNMIKRRIEGLIEREYLERVEESTPPAYRYLA